MTNWHKLGVLSSALLASFSPIAAESVRVNQHNQPTIQGLLQSQSALSSNQSGNYFAPVNSNGVKQHALQYQRLQQYVLSTPVWGQQLSVQNGKSQHISGFYAQNINVSQLSPQVDSEVNFDAAARKILQKAKLSTSTRYEIEESKRYVYLHKGKAVFAQKIKLHIEEPGVIQAPTALVLEDGLEVVKYWNDIHHVEATGPGGNEKMGRLEFGQDLPEIGRASCRERVCMFV